MKIFEVCLTNYCNFKCDYCISDKTRGADKFSEPLKLDADGNLLLHDRVLSEEEVSKRKKMLDEQGQAVLDAYVESEHNAWMARRHLKHDYTDWLNFDSLITFVRTQLNNEWIVTLTGGEPLYYPKIEYLIEELTKTNKVVVTTNASMIRNKTSLLKIDRDMLYFRVGFHPEFRNLDTFKECIKFIIDNNFKYIINYVAHPKYYENGSTLLQSHLDFLKTNKYEFEITEFEGRYNNTNYPIPAPIRDKSENELFKDSLKYSVTRSPMGESFIMCEPDGKIYECQGKLKTLGDVYENELRLEQVRHKECFSYRGCNSSRSANLYLDRFLGEKIS